jgi:hypothetical protein
MDVVAHQTIGPYLQMMFLRIEIEQVQIGLPIFIVKEDGRAIVAALRDVMWVAGGYDACDSWHGGEDRGKIRAGQQKIRGVSLVFLEIVMARNNIGIIQDLEGKYYVKNSSLGTIIKERK